MPNVGFLEGQCLFLAPNGHGAVVAARPLSGPQQTSFALSEYFAF
jgi:hypothetical protein